MAIEVFMPHAEIPCWKSISIRPRMESSIFAMYLLLVLFLGKKALWSLPFFLYLHSCTTFELPRVFFNAMLQ